MEYLSRSEAETTRIGSELAAALSPDTVVALYGDLGAGKTAFVRGMAEGLGLDARVSSPTFTIVNEYLGRVPLFHFDMYRLADADELFEIGWEDYIRRGGVCAVEWSENVEDAFYKDTVRVYIEKADETTRRIRIVFPDDGEDK
ncbi:MAG: tRNA (adenosine(37)-N6)-threonylcarbamoyltransferase complex ATPase subunit type 1 TsaE [Oscillospiraceae bacterium]|nr:tRNA (adenosine(37)-N6)-threonylcarbamoyltransferase complex ATPase subunit type 1 TsaE [Oscillospiraceae bacterium]